MLGGSTPRVVRWCRSGSGGRSRGAAPARAGCPSGHASRIRRPDVSREPRPDPTTLRQERRPGVAVALHLCPKRGRSMSSSSRWVECDHGSSRTGTRHRLRRGVASCRGSSRQVPGTAVSSCSGPSSWHTSSNRRSPITWCANASLRSDLVMMAHANKRSEREALARQNSSSSWRVGMPRGRLATAVDIVAAATARARPLHGSRRLQQAGREHAVGDSRRRRSESTAWTLGAGMPVSPSSSRR